MNKHFDGELCGLPQRDKITNKPKKLQKNSCFFVLLSPYVYRSPPNFACR